MLRCSQLWRKYSNDPHSEKQVHRSRVYNDTACLKAFWELAVSRSSKWDVGWLPTMYATGVNLVQQDPREDRGEARIRQYHYDILSVWAHLQSSPLRGGASMGQGHVRGSLVLPLQIKARSTLKERKAKIFSSCNRNSQGRQANAQGVAQCAAEAACNHGIVRTRTSR